MILGFILSGFLTALFYYLIEKKLSQLDSKFEKRFGAQKKVLYWYKKSAEQGNATAQNNLALMYDNGQGTLTDPKQAFYWYEKSAEQGVAIAQYNLAIMYYYGQGTTTNKKQAAYWMRKAYNNGIKKAKEV